jgi:hypothetical protein
MAYAGQLATTDMFMPSSYTSYDSDFEWTAATTNPAIEDGTIQARYIQLGPKVSYYGKILMGSTTTYGSGEWRLSLPVEAATTITNAEVGSVWLRDSGGPGDYVAVPIIAAAGYFVIRPGAASFGGSNVLDATHPFGWGSGDWISWSMEYEAA